LNEPFDLDKIYPQVVVNNLETWKPNIVIYEIIKKLKNLDKGEIIEVITKYNKGILKDIITWCEASGQIYLGSQNFYRGLLSSSIQKDDFKKNDHKMTVVISTASLEKVLFPLDKALGGAVLGMEVNVLFEGAGVRLLKKDYRSKLSGLLGRFFTGMVEKALNEKIGQPIPQRSIKILEELGAHFYICGPSMSGYSVHENELIVKEYTIAAVVTWAKLLGNTDIHIFSSAQFERP
jgi:predicted peroxiredoxin/TusA-related sulfurtransferase